MSIRRLILLFLIVMTVQPVFAQNAPSIQSFTADLRSVTPTEAEQGVTYTNLAWQASSLPAGDQLVLQVFVLGEWRDTATGPLPSVGTIRWAVPHSLDFQPPTMRLVIRDSNNRLVDDAQLAIPYSTGTDPQNPPQIAYFSSPETAFNLGSDVTVQWQINNRPAGSNMRFQQVLDNDRTLNIELPRERQWILSTGEGVVHPLPDGDSIHLLLELYDVASGNVYAQQTIDLPTVSDPVQPAITAFSVDSLGHKRGETLNVTWATQQTSGLRLELHDIDFFPSSMGAPTIPYKKFENLPASGSLDIPIPADYGGAGWQVHFLVLGGQPGFVNASQRIDVLFTDAKQPVMLQINQFELNPSTITRGETLTFTWDTNVVVRGISTAGKIDWIPTHNYDNQLWLDLFAVAEMAASPGSLLNPRWDGQPLKGSIQWQVPDYEPMFIQLVSNIGLKLDTGMVTYDIRNIELRRATPTTQTVQAAYQPFESGFMIWNGSSGDVYTYFNTGRADTVLQSIYSGFIDTTNSATPPEGFIRPHNAFGLVWGGYDYLEFGLGWATSAEQGYSAILEFPVDSSGVFISLPDGRKVFQTGYTWNYQ